MDRAKGFQVRDTRLHEFRVEIWHGFIFVNLDGGAQPLAPRLAGLTAKLATLNLVDQKTLWHDEEFWNANWKTVIEQTMESYHLFQVHQKTLDPHTATKTAEYVPGEPGYNHHTLRFTKPVNPATPMMWRATIYPSVVIDIGDSLSWTTVIPQGIGQSRVYTGQAVVDPPTPGSLRARQFVAGGQAFNARLNNEDRAAVTSVHSSVRSRHRRPGRLSHLEGTVWEFGRYLVRQLAPSSE
jgi:choline monooxygenase